MRYTQEQLEFIYDRTDGRCHMCDKRLAFKNYGIHGAKAAWQVDHLLPVSRGGSDHGRNLMAACIPCNLEKSNGSHNVIRAQNGLTKAPMSKAKRAEAKSTNAVLGGVGGAMLAGASFGPPGVILGALLGAALGGSIDPE